MRRFILLSAAASIVLASTATAETVAHQETAALLSPFTLLYNTAAGRQVLAENLAVSIAVNNGSDAAQRLQARSDNAIIPDQGIQFTEALGTQLDSAYQAAVAANDARLGTSGTIVQTFRAFTGVSGGNSAFNKIFLANGTSDNVNPAVGISLPAGGKFNVYDLAYGVSKNDPGQNPNGNSRPFQVAPGQIDPFAADITATLTANSAIPSGHTTFGTTEALLQAIAVPERFQQEVARGLDYGYSRVVLGAHYALDVIAGRILATQNVAKLLNNDPNYTGGADFATLFNNFTQSFRQVLTDYSGSDIASAAKIDSGRFSNAAQTKADAIYRLTYGLSPVGDTTLAPVVPTGAEVLLKTRFNYLTDAQRRDVLASTELASGGPLDDGSGWARLNLYAAGGGYGAFNGNVVINQDSALGSFGAFDTFSNDIGGAGSFTHTGDGTLQLTGNNSYSGGTVISDGTVIAASATALGTGDVLIDGGTLKVVAPDFVIGGNFAETADGTLILTSFGPNPFVTIDGSAALNGALVIDFSKFNGQFGNYQLLDYANFAGSFDSVRFNGLHNWFTPTLRYENDGLFLNIAGVPEPGNWALLIAGFGLVGGAARRRKPSIAVA